MNIAEEAVEEAARRVATGELMAKDAKGFALGYIEGLSAQEPSDADFNRAAQAFYEASGLNLPHTSKPEVVAGVRAAWAALLAARNEREGN